MSNFLKYTAAIRNEEGDKMCLGSHRTLSLIEAEFSDLVNDKIHWIKTSEALIEVISRINKYASNPSLDNSAQMAEALRWIIEECESVLPKTTADDIMHEGMGL